ncbi:hypothetical protein DMUE_5209 [Dictyocoela muelleri]|nr:hypothetical protein DMUE_5209 [Dictyocoela muelleri]
MVSYKENLYCFYFNNSKPHHQSGKNLVYNSKDQELTGKGQLSRPNLCSNYHRYLLGLAPLGEHDMMNSSVQMPEFKKYVSNKKSFNMNSADTDILTSNSIDILENIDKQNVNSWAKHIKSLVINNNFLKSEFLAIIRTLLSDEYLKIIDNIKDPVKALYKILYLKYNRNYAEIFQNKFRLVKQVYKTIEEYYYELENLINEISKCNNWDIK